ncbi:ATP-binding protein [Streptomyces brasiliscabiei]|uniref:ATP-binding protein n=1 Tax=Streptomyces brasiliscabiei TaxID=2736302 RepID=UPI001F24BBF0|nr:ATP-binding protein [Streptomyces brasiliscabiei]
MPADHNQGRRDDVTATTTKAKTLHVSSLHLAAVLTAVPVSRAFVRQTLAHWNLADYADETALIMSELVGNAVKATGIQERAPKPWQITAQHVVAIQLRAVDDELHAEVWDRSALNPVKQTVTAEAEGGRGLHLVEAVAKEWGIYRPPAGGKIVWAKVALTTAPSPEPDGPTLQLRVPDHTLPRSGPVKEQASIALMECVLDGLRAGCTT